MVINHSWYLLLINASTRPQLQSTSSSRQDQERRELEQTHSKVLQQLETRLYDVENSNKVGIITIDEQLL